MEGNVSSSGKKARGGVARANALTPEERKEIARNAALARWNANVPKATHDGEFKVGGTTIFAAVLPNGKRLINQASLLRALGRSRSPKGGTGVLSTVDGLPFFLQAEALKPFISDDLQMSTTPIFFLTKDGKRAVGYDAELLPNICDVYLKLRDERLAETGTVPSNYRHIIKACDILMRGLAHVGIVALVDEATGYQQFRDKRALQAILEKYLSKELAAWVKRFPDEFYEQIYRLRDWEWKGMEVNRPQIVAKYTKDIVYERLAPGILKELEARNPLDEKGKRKSKHHQWLSGDIGNPALSQHLHAVTALMKVSKSWENFQEMLNQAFPKKDETLPFLFTDGR